MLPPDDFYAPLTERLSQGDIVQDVPWGLIDAPVTVCTPVDRSKAQGKAAYAPAGSSGASARAPLVVHARAKIGPALTLWHDCQIDKFLNQGRPEQHWFTAIAPVLPLAEAAQGADAIKAGTRRPFFYLPAYPALGLAEDSYVDLRHIWPVKQSILTVRIGTLSLWAREALYGHLMTFLLQRRLTEMVACPSCGRRIPSTELLVPLGEGE